MRRVISACVVACVASAGSPARAEGEAARAQALFDEAVATSRKGDYAAACPAFAASQTLDPKTSTLLNLASCYELTGRTASAWAAFREAEAAALRYERRDWAKRAHDGATRLAPQVKKLTVRVGEAASAPNLVVEMDGVRLPAVALDAPMPVDPGEHRIAWSAPGYLGMTKILRVEAEDVEVSLEALAREPNPEPVPPPKAEPVTSGAPSQPIAFEQRRFWTAGRVVGAGVVGAGVASAVVGTVFGIIARDTYRDAERTCGGTEGAVRECLPETSALALRERADAQSFADTSTVLFVVGGALAAGGAVLFLVTPPRSPTRVSVVPTTGGILAVGTF